METCAGCGAKAPRHPIGGVGRDASGTMVEFPVCAACHRDPAHRKHPLKMHFFERTGRPNLAAQVQAAEDNILVTPAEGDDERAAEDEENESESDEAPARRSVKRATSSGKKR